MNEFSGKGYGKVILFGEHFVVYGLPGIASGLKDIYIKSSAKKINEEKVIIEDNSFFKGEKVDVYKDTNTNKSKYYKPIFDYKNSLGVKINWEGNISYSGGMGFSAAAAVSMIRAMDKLNNWNLTNEEINNLAFECEKIANGNPSGIDNTCATYGSLVFFIKQKPINVVETFKSKQELFLVLVDTNILHETDKIVADVKKRKEKNEKEFLEIFNEAEELVLNAKEALIKGNIQLVGKLMTKNHLLLKKIGVSCKELDALVKIALENGALGAKLTGAGKGGLILVLVKNEEEQKKLAELFNKKGYKTMITRVF